MLKKNKSMEEFGDKVFEFSRVCGMKRSDLVTALMRPFGLRSLSAIQPSNSITSGEEINKEHKAQLRASIWAEISMHQNAKWSIGPFHPSHRPRDRFGDAKMQK